MFLTRVFKLLKTRVTVDTVKIFNSLKNTTHTIKNTTHTIKNTTHTIKNTKHIVKNTQLKTHS